MLDKPVQLGAGTEPFELLVVEVTDQGKRRPTRVARLLPPGAKRAEAELISPRLVWWKGFGFVLSGTEELASAQGLVHVAQSWACRLASPPGAVGFRARHTHDAGAELRHAQIFDRYGKNSKGRLSVSAAHEEALGRQAVLAVLHESDGVASLEPPVIIDAELIWMSEERFSLVGLAARAASQAYPARLVRQGWLCEYELAEAVEPTRKPKSVR